MATNTNSSAKTTTLGRFSGTIVQLQHFHRFVDLPRELQLCIWDIHEADNIPHYHHYFRRMVVYSGRLYAAADRTTGLIAYTVAGESDPYQKELPDRGLTPNTKIRLPGDTHWLCTNGRPCAEWFKVIQQPSPAPGESYVWANFKHDTFCFANARGDVPGADFLDYLQAEDGLAISPAAVPEEDGTQWFFRIRHLALVITGSEQRRLGAFDRRALANHPSLRTLAIVATGSHFYCRETGRRPGVAWQEGGSPRRIPLNEFLAILEAAGCCCSRCGADAEETPAETGSSCCITARADELRALGREAEGLFVGREDRVPRVSIEVEASWREKPDVGALLAARREREAQARRLSEHAESSQPGGGMEADGESVDSAGDIHSDALPGADPSLSPDSA